jgi:hypothetical protein
MMHEARECEEHSRAAAPNVTAYQPGDSTKPK